MSYIAIDIHLNNMLTVAINENGKVVGQAKLPIDNFGAHRLFNCFDALPDLSWNIPAVVLAE